MKELKRKPMILKNKTVDREQCVQSVLGGITTASELRQLVERLHASNGARSVWKL